MFIAFFLILILISSFSLVYAEDETTEDTTEETTTTNEDAAYECLKDRVGDTCEDITANEDLLFATLALGNYNNCGGELEEEVSGDGCFPQGDCDLRQTAITLLAYSQAGKNSDQIAYWLSDQNKTSTDLVWYLQIDADEATDCTIKYDGKSYGTDIDEDRKVDSGAGSCLKVSDNDYWLELDDSEDCLSNEYTISCDKEFKTSLLYQRQNADTIFVSSETHSASPEAETKEQANSLCFAEGSSCDYEGTLWTALALSKKGASPKPYLPYLTALAEDNEKYFPSSFLYILTNYEEYLSDITTSQQSGSFWNLGAYNKYYDTALAFLSYSGTETDSAKAYLFEPGVQDSDGCWGTTRDTGFLLYAGWGGETTPTTDDCEPSFYCETLSQCTDTGGNVLTEYTCSGSDVCCSVDYTPPTCSAQGGEICSTGQTCANPAEHSGTGTCCLTDCETESTSSCEQRGYSCIDEDIGCFGDQQETDDYSCTYGYVCCMPEEPGTGMPWWLWVLIILIIIVVLGIIFRKKLQMFLFKRKSKFRRGTAPGPTRPGYPPRPGMRPMPRRPRHVYPRAMPTRRPIPRPRRAASGTDNALNETLRKLKEMTK